MRRLKFNRFWLHLISAFALVSSVPESCEFEKLEMDREKIRKSFWNRSIFTRVGNFLSLNNSSSWLGRLTRSLPAYFSTIDASMPRWKVLIIFWAFKLQRLLLPTRCRLLKHFRVFFLGVRQNFKNSVKCNSLEIERNFHRSRRSLSIFLG